MMSPLLSKKLSDNLDATSSQTKQKRILLGLSSDTFAYDTIKERLPVILARIADTVFRSKAYVKENYGEDAQEELKAIAGCISKLRNEVQTSKPVLPITDDRTDTQMWNDYLIQYTEKHGSTPSWFTAPWLYVECYMYRRVQEAIEQRTLLKNFDVFREQKERALTDSNDAMLILFNYLLKITEQLESSGSTELNIETLFKQFVQMSLWGNKCDLSISAGMDKAQTACPLDQVNTLCDKILINDLDSIWKQISGQQGGRVDIVLDNAGFEVITDLCLAEFLASTNLATTIHFHGKAIPWFVSDVTQNDLNFTLQHLGSSNSLSMNMFMKRWKNRFEGGSWVYESHDFWTTMHDYSDMKTVVPELYKDLGQAKLVFFKGDLNYRKLVGDLDWPTTTPFEVSLRGFHPAPLCTLRTLKADVVTGLKEGQERSTREIEEKWMISGNWAVMSFCGRTEALQ